MKELLIIVACVFFYQALMAQSWKEWFQQNNTQLLYLQEQISALQACQTTQKNGYMVSEEGLVGIDTTAVADYDEHAAHFAYLRTASRNVLSCPRIAEIDTLCERTMQVADAIESMGFLRTSGGLDWQALSQNIARTFEDSVFSVTSRLVNVLTADKLQMSDAEREKTIVILHLEAKGIYAQASAIFKEFTEKTILP